MAMMRIFAEVPGGTLCPDAAFAFPDIQHINDER
jgi:hypothetical protein